MKHLKFKNMKKLYLSAAVIAALLFSGAVLTSCDDDDDKTPDNNPNTITFENVTAVKNYVQSGTFDAAQPGGTTTIVFNAGKGQTLMFATMYGYSNDLFFAPENPGLKLYNDDGRPARVTCRLPCSSGTTVRGSIRSRVPM